jgi:hypothetical protein
MTAAQRSTLYGKGSTMREAKRQLKLNPPWLIGCAPEIAPGRMTWAPNLAILARMSRD